MSIPAVKNLNFQAHDTSIFNNGLKLRTWIFVKPTVMNVLLHLRQIANAFGGVLMTPIKLWGCSTTDRF